VWLEETSSTQEVVRGWGREGRPGGLALVADRQSTGRGRMGRVWEAEPGEAVQLSVLLRPKLSPRRLSLVSLALGVAVHEAVGSDAMWLKWPNDLLAPDGRKVAGVLAEAELAAGLVDFVIAGVGVNVGRAPQGVPTASCLDAWGIDIDRERLAVRLQAAIRTWSQLAGTAPSKVITAWTERSRMWGKRWTVGGREGIAEALGDQGALHLRLADGTCHRVLAGDVEMVKVEHR
jgi:BirA family biotin operon repressor/biotin-[acetyl-CoA-carboxylase] ligase